MKRPDDLTSKLKTSDTEIRNYVFELEKENFKLQNQIAKLQVKNVSQQNQITAIKKAKPKSLAEILIGNVKKKNR
jgi:hypothetical protein